MTKPNWFQIGQIIGVFGVRGEVKVKPFMDDPTAALQAKVWGLGESAQGLREVTLVHGRRHGPGLVVKLAGWDSPEAASALQGQTLWLPREYFPEPEEDAFYWQDLTGCRVVDEADGSDLGVVRGLFSTGSNDVLVVGREGERQERLLPFIRDVVIQVDMENRRLTVRLLPGL
ncbi:MAG: 16S rRNA processing protein RimM [Magnetococcales bacterium]|nr:16S rRNA processing protein RimM [Magnetococcales bacterium]